MRNLFICWLLIITMTGGVWAAKEEGTITFQVSVPELFNISLNRTDIDLGSTTPPDIVELVWQAASTDTALQIDSQINTNTHWTLGIEAVTDFLHSDQSTTLAASALKWMIVYTEANGTDIQYKSPSNSNASFQDLSTTITTAFSSQSHSPNNQLNGTTRFKTILKLVTPIATKAGEYSTSLKFTLSKSGSSTTATIPIKFKVASWFNVDLNQNTIDFGTIKPPSNLVSEWKTGPNKTTGSQEALKVICNSNTYQHWNVKIEALSDLINKSDSTSIIPLSALQWKCVYASNNDNKLDFITSDFPAFGNTTPVTVYDTQTNGPKTALSGTTNFEFIFMLIAPQTTKAGDYETSIRFTITE